MSSHRVVPLAELAAKERIYELMKGPIRGIIKKLTVGMPVKIRVEAIGKPKPAPEEIWVVITGIKNHKRFVGSVNTRTERFIHHGLMFNDLIEFGAGDILDTSIQGGAEVAKRQ